MLEKPVEFRSIRLAPGERAEILVDFSDGHAVALQTGPDTNAPMMMGMMARLREGAYSLLGGGGQAVLRFEPTAAGGRTPTVPECLMSREKVDPASATRRRRFVLTMGMGGMMGGGMRGVSGAAPSHGMDPEGMMGTHGINGRPFDMSRIDERVRLGDTEIWEVSGEMFAHPFHVHGVQFEVLSRNGARPDVRDQGLRDTVLVKEPVELLVRFTQPAETKQFMYHCHILEHEDNGMMGQFLTT